LTPACGLAGADPSYARAALRAVQEAATEVGGLGRDRVPARDDERSPMTDLNGKKIAIIATDHFEEAELLTPRDELAKAGAEVKVYSSSTNRIQAVEGDTNPTQKVDVD